MNPLDIDRIVADFRTWLTELSPAEAEDTLAVPAASPVLDLTSIVQQFIALRQEVNLQTRATRTQTEQNNQTLAQLAEAVEALRAEPAEDEENAAESVLRPVLKSLLEVRDALALAERQVRKLNVPETDSPTLEAMPLAESNGAASSLPPPIVLALPGWTRWTGVESRVRDALAPLQEWTERQPQAHGLSPAQRGELHAWHNRHAAEIDRFVEAFEQMRESFDSIRAGYGMSLQRIDRLLEQLGLERIDSVGETFDPESMEAVEIVREPNRDASEVIEELRPGYRWLDKVFRYAHVRVARPA
ncbi:MAG: nucleotide exchange factor GrpE [Gemmataceae bacterium]|nr:nucleotide exchange factor GrpE [Gemmataceae bacterium]